MGSAGAVHPGAVVDSKHHHDTSSVVDLVDDSVGTAACGVESSEFSLESSADPMWIVHQGRQHELDYGGGGALGKAFELALGRAGDA